MMPSDVVNLQFHIDMCIKMVGSLDVMCAEVMEGSNTVDHAAYRATSKKRDTYAEEMVSPLVLRSQQAACYGLAYRTYYVVLACILS